MGAAWLASRLLAVLPRVSRAMLLGWLEAPDLDAEEIDPALLPDAAAAAWGVGSLRGKSASHIRARRAAVHMLDRLAPRSGTAATLGIPLRSATRYRLEAVAPSELRAVELQLKLRGLVRRRIAEASAPAPGAS